MIGFLYKIFQNNFLKNTSFTKRISIVITILFSSIPFSSIHGCWNWACCDCDDDDLYGYGENLPLQIHTPRAADLSYGSGNPIAQQPASSSYPSTSRSRESMPLEAQPLAQGHLLGNTTLGAGGRTMGRQPALTRPTTFSSTHYPRVAEPYQRGNPIAQQPASSSPSPSSYSSTSCSRESIRAQASTPAQGHLLGNTTLRAGGRTMGCQPARTRPTTSSSTYVPRVEEPYQSGLERIFSTSNKSSKPLDFNERRGEW